MDISELVHTRGGARLAGGEAAEVATEAAAAATTLAAPSAAEASDAGLVLAANPWWAPGPRVAPGGE